jgi:hypothetical protein
MLPKINKKHKTRNGKYDPSHVNEKDIVPWTDRRRPTLGGALDTFLVETTDLEQAEVLPIPECLHGKDLLREKEVGKKEKHKKRKDRLV